MMSKFDDSFVSVNNIPNIPHLISPTGYMPIMQTSIPAIGLRYGLINERSTDSPPLSHFEINDIMQSEEEFRSGALPVFNNAEEFILSLMREREENNARE